MKRALFNVVIPILLMAIWLMLCYPVCSKAEGFDFFLYWILAGLPYGIRKMCAFLIPKNFGIGGSMGVLALNGIIGGLIGGVVLLFRIGQIFMEIITMLRGYFWTSCPEVIHRTDDV